jgi:hypothetical protein
MQKFIELFSIGEEWCRSVQFCFKSGITGFFQILQVKQKCCLEIGEPGRDIFKFFQRIPVQQRRIFYVVIKNVLFA